MAVLWWIMSLFLLTTFQQTGTRAQGTTPCHPPSSLEVIDSQVSTTSFAVTFTHMQCGDVNFTISLGPQLCFGGSAFEIALHCETVIFNIINYCYSDRTSGFPEVACTGSLSTDRYTCGISRLDPGQSYSLSVSAVKAGVEFGSAQLEQPVVTNPEVPANLTAVPSLTSTVSITVDWDVVGLAEQFLITATCYHDSCVNRTTTFSLYDCLQAQTATINYLTPGAWYSLTVASLSGGKSGAESMSIIEQTDPVPPSNMTFNLVNVTSLVMMWGPAEGVYDGYNLSCTSCVGQQGLPIFLRWGESRYLYDALTRGQVYNFTIITVSGSKYSKPKETFQVVDPAPVENITVLSIGSRHVILEWRPPEGVYSHFIIKVTSNRGEDMVKSNSLNASLADLTPGIMYNFIVYTVSGDKESVGTEYGPVLTLEEPPGPVSNLILIAFSSTMLKVSWQPPQEPNGAITSYTLRVRNSAEEEWNRTVTLFPSVSTTTVSPAMSIVVTLFPSVSTTTVSPAMSMVTTTNRPTTCFEEGIHVRCGVHGSGTYHPDMSTLECDVFGAVPHNVYVVEVFAATAPGSGDEQYTSQRTQQDRPYDPPTNIVVYNISSSPELNTKTVNVTWAPPNEPNGDASYTVYITDSVGITISKNTSTGICHHVVSDLASFSTYRVTVAAFTIVGYGPESEEVTFTTEVPQNPTTADNMESSTHETTKMRSPDGTETSMQTSTPGTTGRQYPTLASTVEAEKEPTNLQSLNGGVIAGISVAVVAVVAIAFGVGLFCYRRQSSVVQNSLRRKQKQAGMSGNRADEMMNIQAPSEGTASREDIMSSQLIVTHLGNRDNMASTAGGIVNESLEMSYTVPEDSGQLSQVQTVDDVSKFLQYHNFAEYTGVFQDHEVDGDALRCLDFATLKDLMPKAGPRAKFNDILKQQGREQKISKATSERQVTRLMFREIPRENLKLGKLLGRGQFGEVRLGEVRNRGVTTTVAVKTLHASALDSDRKDLLGELDILVTVGRHDNVISLVGACTIDNPLCVVVEYAPNGSLKDWLKANSPEQIKQDSGYCNIETPAASLPMEQLIQFGIDVASGMSHLAAMQCVHRDLAARNILLGEGLVAKVSDFGLSRDIYEDAEYVKTTLTKLPLRWMAYESLFYKVYTTQSDVWSYGVLLWEIMTMGKLPYQGIKGKEMMNMIKDGYRLEKPALCPDDIYDVMTSCWQNLPGDRPTFPQLKTSLDRIVQQYKTYASLLK